MLFPRIIHDSQRVVFRERELWYFMALHEISSLPFCESNIYYKATVTILGSRPQNPEIQQQSQNRFSEMVYSPNYPIWI